jgi:3-hydroxyisobutyrate dehydrogenase
MNPTIAFIGLGVMGSPMAQNLVKHNFIVQGWNRTQTDRPLLGQARDRGVTIKSTIKEAVNGADFICICVSDGQDVKEVIFGAGGVAENAKIQATIIDFSTIGPTAAQEIYQRLTGLKLNFMDAPISGGDVGA